MLGDSFKWNNENIMHSDLTTLFDVTLAHYSGDESSVIKEISSYLCG